MLDILNYSDVKRLFDNAVTLIEEKCMDHSRASLYLHVNDVRDWNDDYEIISVRLLTHLEITVSRKTYFPPENHEAQIFDIYASIISNENKAIETTSIFYAQFIDMQEIIQKLITMSSEL